MFFQASVALGGLGGVVRGLDSVWGHRLCAGTELPSVVSRGLPCPPVPSRDDGTDNMYIVPKFQTRHLDNNSHVKAFRL